MANELATILARRRAKAGEESDSPFPSTEKINVLASSTTPAVQKSSISERIARINYQSAADDAVAPAPAAPRLNPPVLSLERLEDLQSSSCSVGTACVASAASESIDTSVVAAAQEAAGIRKASSKILQLQGSLGINVNSFGRPKGVSSGNRSGERESIMSTGEEQYGNTRHAMGVAMPGLTGSAIPMPGLAKRGFRLPGTAAEDEQRAKASAALDDSHTTINRVAGPKRRGPMRPPPGAFRLPTVAAPILDHADPVPSLASDSAAVAVPSPAEAVAPEALIQVSRTPPVPDALYARRAPSSPAPIQYPVTSPLSVSTPAPAAAASLPKLPEPGAIPPMRPYQIQDDDPYAPKYDNLSDQNPYVPAGFPSALMANFAMDELTIDDKPIVTPAASSTSSTSSLLSTPVPKNESTPQLLSSPTASVESPHPVPTHAVAPSPTPAPERPLSPVPVVPLPAPAKSPAHIPVPVTPSPSLKPAPVVLTPVQTPAPTPAPVFAPASKSDSIEPALPLSSNLFGGTADDDDFCESDWSDAESDGESHSLFGAQDATCKPIAPAPAPDLFTPSLPKPELHHTTSLSGSLSSLPTPSASPAHGFVQATPQAALPPASYSSLFGGVASSSSESDSDSDDATGLFGT